MAGGQAQRFGAGETTAEFMERRRREVARRDEAEAEGRKAWAASSRTGQNFSAPRPQDVVALGYRMLEPETRRRGGLTRGPSPRSSLGRSDPSRSRRPFSMVGTPRPSGSNRYPTGQGTRSLRP